MASHPDDSGLNPYIELFYAALGTAGIELAGPVVCNDSWLHSCSTQIDALHFHWPEDLWRARGETRRKRLRGVIGLLRFLRLARRKGLLLIWTVHNLEHHEGVEWIDRLGYRVLGTHCDLLIVHSESAADALRRRGFSRSRIVVMPHGNYDGVYPEPRPREAVLRQYGLRADLPTVCCLGKIRRYKGVDIAVEAIREFDGGVQLLVAGSPHASVDIERLRKETANVPTIALIDRGISEQEFADIAAASEAVLLPYRKITGSGALLAALTMERPVVAVDHAYFRETLAPAPEAGVLVRPEDAKALAQGIRTILGADRESVRGAAARLREHYRWDRVVGPVVRELRSLSAHRRNQQERGR